MPSTRPGLKFDENEICHACIIYDKQNDTDWKSRWEELEKLCDKYRGCNGDGYDCAIAVSGGKDSHFQTHVLKEKLGMNPLLLSIANIEWTKTGWKNFTNISDAFGCDIIAFHPNVKIARKMFKKAFEKLGSPTWYQDYLIYSFPVRMCMKLGIKLLVYGEDVNYTYGGEFSNETPSAMLQPQNNVTKPVWDEWFDKNEITKKDLESIKQPTIEECEKFGLDPIYLSYFVPWNSVHNYEVAKRYGFRHLGHEYTREGSLDNYDQIDNIPYLLNPYLKYLKFGHSVATDNGSRWIRYGIKTREEMIPLIKEIDGKLDQGIVDSFCDFIQISHREFWQIMDKWYNRDLFEQDSDGVWHPKFKVGTGLKK
jgi:N-acetyl sugar amidotransferase